tara:strand:- start:247 stop:351 length:105 start_codon:yes stop_codon:yes gene_type:complete
VREAAVAGIGKRADTPLNLTTVGNVIITIDASDT